MKQLDTFLTRRDRRPWWRQRRRASGAKIARRRGTSAVVAIALASIMAGCSSTATGSGGQSPAPTGSLAAATPSPTAGPISTTTPATSAPVGSVRVEFAGPPGRFVPKDLTATAGDVVYFLDNTSPGTHSLAIGPKLYEVLVASAVVRRGTAAVFEVHGLETGEYIIWCTIDNHAAEGMVGTLMVK